MEEEAEKGGKISKPVWVLVGDSGQYRILRPTWISDTTYDTGANRGHGGAYSRTWLFDVRN